MHFTTSILSAILATTALASPIEARVDKRATTWCNSWDSLVSGTYTIFHNNWGAGTASSGSQCTTFTSDVSNSVAWSTSWSWAGGAGQVKSYSNVALEKVNKKLSAIKSIPSTWTWRYTGTNVIADVSYDIWLAPTASSDNTYEIMIWLGAYGGALPISSTGSTIATPTIAGTKWDLYKGPNGDTTVFSFVAPSHLGNFEGDLNGFFTYLVKSQGVASSSVMTALQAGTEPFSGSNAVFTTYSYKTVVN